MARLSDWLSTHSKGYFVKRWGRGGKPHAHTQKGECKYCLSLLSLLHSSCAFINCQICKPDCLRCKHLRLEESCFTNIQTKPDGLGLSEIHRHHIFVNCLFNVQEIVARIYPPKNKHLQWWSLSVLQQLVIHILILFLIFYRVATVVVISRRKLKAIVKLFALLYHTHDKYILKH